MSKNLTFENKTQWSWLDNIDAPQWTDLANEQPIKKNNESELFRTPQKSFFGTSHYAQTIDNSVVTKLFEDSVKNNDAETQREKDFIDGKNPSLNNLKSTVKMSPANIKEKTKQIEVLKRGDIVIEKTINCESIVRKYPKSIQNGSRMIGTSLLDRIVLTDKEIKGFKKLKLSEKNLLEGCDDENFFVVGN